MSRLGWLCKFAYLLSVREKDQIIHLQVEICKPFCSEQLDRAATQEAPETQRPGACRGGQPGPGAPLQLLPAFMAQLMVRRTSLQSRETSVEEACIYTQAPIDPSECVSL